MTPELRFALGDVLEAAEGRRDQWRDAARGTFELDNGFYEAPSEECQGIADRMTRSISIVQEYLEKGAPRNA